MNKKHSAIPFITLAILLLMSLACGSSTTPSLVATSVPPAEPLESDRVAEADVEIPSPDNTEIPSPDNTEIPTTTSTVTPAPQGLSPLMIITANTTANLRAGPGITYEIVGSALRGSTLHVYAETESGWYQVDSEGNKWIAASLTEVVKAPREIPVPLSTTAPLPPASPGTSTKPISQRTVIWRDIEETSYADVKRFGIKVTTTFPITRAEAQAICQDVIAEFKMQRSFNAVIVFIYEEGSDLDWMFTIAACDYAPGGEWGDAHLVKTGDYRTHSFSYQYADDVDH